ncbi:MAG: lipopolysaccharide assembly protein LapA domain-containing protein [Deltaproteobacteria bacterium]|nr:lipopolysaccharide assembly protein LapA domain-containing protein [Deltaproteobacteria bacterium]
MRFLIFIVLLLIFLSIFGYFIFNNLVVVDVKFWGKHSVSAPLGVVILAAALIGVILGFSWHLWSSLVSFFNLKSKDHLINQLIESYKTTAIMNQALVLGENELAKEIVRKLKAPIPELDFYVEIERAKTVLDLSDRVKVFEQLRAKFPTNPYLICELASALVKLGQHQIAFDNLKSLNSIVPTALSLKFGAELALDLNKLDDCQEWLLRLKELGFTDHKLSQASMEKKLVQLYFDNKDWFTEAKKLLKEYPLSLVGLEYLARYYKDSNPVLAAKYLRQRAEIGKELIYWRDLTDFLLEQNKTEEAIKTAIDYVEKVPEEEKALAKLDLAKLYINLNRWNDAFDILTSFSEEELSCTAKVPVEKLSKFYMALINLKRGSTLESLRVLDSVLA